MPTRKLIQEKVSKLLFQLIVMCFCKANFSRMVVSLINSLVCTALYTDGDNERKYLPQFFKFIVSNPLSVRTKVLYHKSSHVMQGVHPAEL